MTPRSQPPELLRLAEAACVPTTHPPVLAPPAPSCLPALAASAVGHVVSSCGLVTLRCPRGLPCRGTWKKSSFLRPSCVPRSVCAHGLFGVTFGVLPRRGCCEHSCTDPAPCLHLRATAGGGAAGSRSDRVQLRGPATPSSPACAHGPSLACAFIPFCSGHPDGSDDVSLWFCSVIVRLWRGLPWLGRKQGPGQSLASPPAAFGHGILALAILDPPRGNLACSRRQTGM